MKRIIAIITLLVASLAVSPPNAGAAGNECLEQEPNVTMTSEKEASTYRLYCAFFLRQPDAAGWTYWKAQTIPVWDIAVQFGASDEFANTYGSLDDEGFMSLIYRNVLSRAEDQAGYDYWVGELKASNVNRGELMVYFSDSDEYRGRISTPLTETSTPGGDGSPSSPFTLGTKASVREYSFTDTTWTMSIDKIVSVPKDATYGDPTNGKECWLVQFTATLTTLDQSSIDNGFLTDSPPRPKLLVNNQEAEPNINDCGTVSDLEADGWGDWVLNSKLAVGGTATVWSVYEGFPGVINYASVGGTAWR